MIDWLSKSKRDPGEGWCLGLYPQIFWKTSFTKKYFIQNKFWALVRNLNFLFFKKKHGTGQNGRTIILDLVNLFYLVQQLSLNMISHLKLYLLNKNCLEFLIYCYTIPQWIIKIIYYYSCGNHRKTTRTITYYGMHLFDYSIWKKCQRSYDGLSISESNSIPSCPCILHWRYVSFDTLDNYTRGRKSNHPIS